MKQHTIKERIESNKIFLHFFECAFSFVLARIISEWYLLSRFQSQFTSAYNFLWINSGFLISFFLVLWMSDWQKKAIKLIDVETDNHSNNSSKGIIYTLQLLIYLINLTIITITISVIFTYSINNDSSIYIIIQNSIKKISNIISTHYIQLIVFTPLLFLKKITKILNFLSNILFIIIISNTWSSNIYLGDHVSRNIISISSQEDILSIFLLIILFILLKLFLYLFNYHTYRNRFSDWSSVKFSIPLSNHILNLFIPLIFIFLFLTGINI